jgi:hypothetical protein
MLQYKTWGEAMDMTESGDAVEIIGYSDYSGDFVDVVNVEFLEGITHYLDGLYRSDGNYGSVLVIGVPSEYSDETMELLDSLKENFVLDEDAYLRMSMKLQEEYYEEISRGLNDGDKVRLRELMDESEIVIEWPYGAFCREAEDFLDSKKNS